MTGLIIAVAIIVYLMSVLVAIAYGIKYGQGVGYKAAIADVKKGDFDFDMKGRPRESGPTAAPRG